MFSTLLSLLSLRASPLKTRCMFCHMPQMTYATKALLLVATEGFECFNAIFRNCSIYSNHQAPSRDIAHQLSNQEFIKHILTGGFWKTDEGSWTRTGAGLRDYLQTTPFLQKLLGWSEAKPSVPGIPSPFSTMYFPGLTHPAPGRFKHVPKSRNLQEIEHGLALEDT